MVEKAFADQLKAKGWQITTDQLDQFQCYYQYLIQWNQQMNLTAITDVQEVYVKHFYDSLLPLWALDIDWAQKSLVDVGSGAGFPSLPLLIMEPTLQVTIIDSLNKRIQFIQALTEALGLRHRVEAIHGRAEDLGQDPGYRGQFDLATARAVASLDVLCEYCLPFVKKKGYFVALKGQKAQEEVHQAQAAIQALGAKYIGTTYEALPNEESQRGIVLVQKTLDTPNKYPRRPGKPSKQPIR